MLNFIGCGSAFNTKLGNNGAFIKENGILFMIDCGSSTFERLLREGLLNDVEKIIVLLTHTHADHIGSLGDLILYSYYTMEKKVSDTNITVFAPYELGIRHILKSMGVEEETYGLIQFEETAGFHYGDFHIDFEAVPVNHVSNLNCYGYIIYYKGKTIYYSGDCNDIPLDILEELHNYKIDLFYQDTCKADYEGNVHLSLRKLNELICFDVRDRVYCMHLDGGFEPEEARALGFKTVYPVIL